MANIQIRDVPDDVHRRLKVQAAASGQSLNDFLLKHVVEFAALPTWSEMAERIAALEPYDGPSAGEIAAIIREERDAR